MKSRPLTIVMYHYVRPISSSRYPGINGLEVDDFREQLSYFDRHYTVVTMNDVIAAASAQQELPDNPALLTFDDGYSDHHDFVLPLLAERRMQGSFFVPADPVVSRRVLDVNKVHLILASCPDAARLAAEIEMRLDAQREVRALPTQQQLRDAWRSATRFDSADVAYVKRLLQHALPEDLRSSLAASLFSRYVSADEPAIAEGLYMSVDDVRELVSAGMHVGGHGNRHQWLGRLDASRQREEIEQSVAFLRAVGAARDGFTFCYPYGDYDADTLTILTELDCAAAFTIRVDVATIPGTPRLELPRLDTNDFPKDRGADAQEWTRAAMARASA